MFDELSKRLNIISTAKDEEENIRDILCEDEDDFIMRCISVKNGYYEKKSKIFNESDLDRIDRICNEKEEKGLNETHWLGIFETEPHDKIEHLKSKLPGAGTLLNHIDNPFRGDNEYGDCVPTDRKYKEFGIFLTGADPLSSVGTNPEDIIDNINEDDFII